MCVCVRAPVGTRGAGKYFIIAVSFTHAWITSFSFWARSNKHGAECKWRTPRVCEISLEKVLLCFTLTQSQKNFRLVNYSLAHHHLMPAIVLPKLLSHIGELYKITVTTELPICTFLFLNSSKITRDSTHFWCLRKANWKRNMCASLSDCESVFHDEALLCVPFCARRLTPRRTWLELYVWRRVWPPPITYTHFRQICHQLLIGSQSIH